MERCAVDAEGGFLGINLNIVLVVVAGWEIYFVGSALIYAHLRTMMQLGVRPLSIAPPNKSFLFVLV